jgi:branched-chain amino acid transport system ATP-binding protein
LLRCANVSKSFGGLQALKEISLAVRDGTITGLVGPNGSGKSTLLNLISGIYTVDSGSISFCGKEISNLPSYKICHQGISRTSQVVQSFQGMTALENVLIGSTFGVGKTISKVDARQKAEDALNFVNFPEEKMNKPVSSLTISELKRIQLAKALSSEPKLLLLDELLTGLNPAECDKEIKLIQKIRESGITVLMIEHVMRIIMGLCDEVAVLHHGEKIAEGTPKEISSNESVIKVYLGKRFLLREKNNDIAERSEWHV